MRFSLVILNLLFLGFYSHVQARECSKKTVDLSILLSIDSSGSVDRNEMKTQLHGYLKAFQDEAIRENLLSCSCAEIAVGLWASNATIALPFTVIKNEASLNHIVNFFNDLTNLNTEVSTHYGLSSMTEVGKSLVFIGDYFIENANLFSMRKVMLVSGDGIEGRGDHQTLQTLRDQRDKLDRNDVTINGLPIVIYENQDPNEADYLHQKQKIYSLINPNTPKDYPSRYKDVADFYEKELITRFGYVEKAYSYDEFSKTLLKSLRKETCNLMM